ncbi:MAG: protein-L-isoaspartate O-methyltransferase [Magnetospirillum sp.]|nr:protein-L-isoaspartate O-methyltransferase [Magnetospirillum sp.]
MDFAAARLNMVENQIRTNKVDDSRVLSALAAVPREVFVPKPMRGFAYVDDDIDVGGGRSLIEPLVLARLLQIAAIGSDEVVLAIGDATGYVSAVIARLAQTVVSLERDAEWVNRASATLTELGIDNAAVVQGRLDQGYPAQAPYDVVVIAGAVGEIPPAICRQLSDGGRLVAVVSPAGGVGKGVLVVRVGDTWGRRMVFDAVTSTLPGFDAPPRFVF